MARISVRRQGEVVEAVVADVVDGFESLLVGEELVVDESPEPPDEPESLDDESDEPDEDDVEEAPDDDLDDPPRLSVL